MIPLILTKKLQLTGIPEPLKKILQGQTHGPTRPKIRNSQIYIIFGFTGAIWIEIYYVNANCKYNHSTVSQEYFLCPGSNPLTHTTKAQFQNSQIFVIPGQE